MPTKPKNPQRETPTEVQGKDLFQTPPYAVNLLIPFIPSRINTIWEPACGHGLMAKRFVYHKKDVIATDIEPHWEGGAFHNFLDDDLVLNKLNISSSLAIITNPPYSLKKKFFQKCLSLGIPFALLIPADYSAWIIDAIRYHGCKKIIPTRRINYITPNSLDHINQKLYIESEILYKDSPDNSVPFYPYTSLSDVPKDILLQELHKSHAQFHSMWLTKDFLVEQTETFVDIQGDKEWI